MAERTTELRSEIKDTRERLGDTLDAIGDRVSPGRIVERRKNQARQWIDTMRDRVMGAAPATPSTVGVRASTCERGGLDGEGVRHAPEAVARGDQGSPLVAGASHSVWAPGGCASPTTEERPPSPTVWSSR